MTATTFSAPDIECSVCANAIQKALAKVEGIAEVAVNVAEKTVWFGYDPVLVSVEVILTRLEHAGFSATVK